MADIGSGAGIPGVPLAIALPTSRFALIEPRRARAAFLEAVADEVGLTNVEIVRRRVEDVHGAYDACVARAFSSPSATWEAAQPLLDPRGVLVYWGGRRLRPNSVGRAGRSDPAFHPLGPCANGTPRYHGPAVSKSSSAAPSASPPPRGDATKTKGKAKDGLVVPKLPDRPDHRDREPEGRRGQVHDSREPGRLPRRSRIPGPRYRPGPAGERLHGDGDPARRRQTTSYHVIVAESPHRGASSRPPSNDSTPSPLRSTSRAPRSSWSASSLAKPD